MCGFSDFRLLQKTGCNFFPFICRWDTNTQINVYPYFCTCTQTYRQHKSLLHLPFFLCFDFSYSAPLLLFLYPVYFSPKCFDLLTKPKKWVTTLRMLTQKYLTLFTLEVFTCVSLSSFPCLPLTHTPRGTPAVLIGDTDTTATLLFSQIWLFCCNVYSYSPPVSIQLSANVTLPQSFLLGARNLELDQLYRQWNITQMQPQQ